LPIIMSVLPSTELDFGRIKVCGRDPELKQLRQALARCCHVTTRQQEAGDDGYSSFCETILIEGSSGTGKSCLVDAFQESILISHDHQHHQQKHHQPQLTVFFCRGKYNEKASDEPFQAIEECMNSLLNQMLAGVADESSSSCTKNWKAVLCQGLSRTELKLLSRTSPVFHDMLNGTDDDVGGGGGGGGVEEDSVSTMMSNIDVRSSSYSFDRLRLALRSFFRIVCQHAIVVVVQDDLQWIDEASLKIIQTIVFDKQAKHLLFLGTHRELGTTHVLHSLLEAKGANKDCPITVLKLGNLDLPAVTNVISSLTRRESCDCEGLAELLLRRTGGNAFFLVQFLRVLNEKGLVHYSFSTYQWEWDVDRVLAETDIADNVLDIVSSKIQQLEEPLQMALKSAAFLGSSRFDIHILSQTMLVNHSCTGRISEQPSFGHNEDDGVVVKKDSEGLAAILDKLVGEGLLEKVGAPGMHKFAHDRIRESVWALLPQGETRASLHLEIGRKLRHLSTCMSSDDEARGKDRLVLMSAFHLNLGSLRVSDAHERDDLIELNVKAAELAFERSCFTPASNYLKAALELIGEERWNVQNYERSLNICTTLAHILLCCGSLGESEAMAQDVIHHARDLSDQLRPYRSLINCQTHGGRFVEAIHTVVAVLKRLGLHVPSRLLLMPMVIVNFIRIKRKLRRMSDSDVLNRPEANEHDVKVMDFVVLLAEVAGTAGDSDMQASALVSLALLNLELGSNPYAALALSSAGFLFGVTGNYESASRYGHLAMQIIADKEEHSVYDAKAMLMCSFAIRHLRKPLPDCLDPVLTAKQIIFDAGAVEYVYLAIVVYSNVYYHCGLCLGPLVRELSTLIETMADYGQRHALSLVECHVQYIQNLMGKSDDPLVLTGEIMNQDKSFKFYTETRQVRALQSFYIYRMCLGYYFGDLALAKEMSSKLFAPTKEGPTPVLAPRFLFQGLIAFALALSTKQRLFYERQGRLFLKRLQEMVRKGCINVHHMMLLLQAEEMALHGELDTVQEAFDEAIRAAGRLGLIHNQALGNERAGVFFLRKGDTAWASTYLSRAWMLYEEWGAKAKSNHLETKYNTLIDKSKLSYGSVGIKARSRFGRMPEISAVEQNTFSGFMNVSI
jgi:predicted ATPase